MRGLGLWPALVKPEVRGSVGPVEEGFRAVSVVARMASEGSQSEGLVKRGWRAPVGVGRAGGSSSGADH